MIRRRSRVYLVLSIAIVCVSVALLLNGFTPRYKNGSVTGVQTFSREEIQAAKVNARPGSLWPPDLRRNESGSAVFSVDFGGAVTAFNQGLPPLAADIAGANAFMNENGRVEACLPGSPDTDLDVAPGGKYFLVPSGASTWEVGECVGSFRAHFDGALSHPRIFTHKDQITVVGVASDRSAGTRIEIVKLVREGLRLIRGASTFLPVTGDSYEILDFDPETERLLVNMQNDLPWLNGSSRLILFSVPTAEAKVLGSAPDYALFLRPETAQMFRN